MTITAVSADGTQHQFPDGTNPSVIDKVMKDYVTSQPAPEQPSVMDRIVASPIGRAVQENVVAPVLGVGTTLSHAVTSDPRVNTIQNSENSAYEGALARNRNTPGYAEARQKAQEVQKNVTADGEAFMPSVQSAIAGTVGLASGLDTSNAMADVASNRQAQYAQDHPKLALAQGVVGSLAAVPEGGAKTAAALAQPTADEIKSAASKGYEQVKAAGLEISPQPVRTMVQNVKSELNDAGFDPVLHPKTARSLERLDDLAHGSNAPNTVPLTQLETERKVAGQASKAAGDNPSDAHMAGIIQDHIDDLVSGLNPTDIVSGDPKAAQTLSDARQAWKTGSKAQTIADAFDRAQNSATGFENGLRQSFRSIANYPRKMRAFSDTEQAAIQTVVRGGKVENAMKLLGKLAPRGIVSAGFDAVLGHATGIGMTPLMVAGEAGRSAANAATVRSAERASQLVRSGGNAAALGPQLTPAGARNALTLQLPAPNPSLVTMANAFFNPQPQQNAFATYGQ